MGWLLFGFADLGWRLVWVERWGWCGLLEFWLWILVTFLGLLELVGLGFRGYGCAVVILVAGLLIWWLGLLCGVVGGLLAACV